jgi:3-oxoacyl-[acyl-carrier protein] reductase
MHEWRALAGKRCLVTGGSSGIGRAMAKLLHDAGAHVLICARGEKRLAAAAADIGRRSDRLHVVRADVSKTSDMDILFGAARQRLGELDVLIANAALAAGGVMDMAEEDIEDVLAINLFGPIACGAASRR